MDLREDISADLFLSLELWQDSLFILLIGIIAAYCFNYVGPIIIKYISSRFNVKNNYLVHHFYIPLTGSLLIVTIYLFFSQSPILSYIEGWLTPIILTLLISLWVGSIMKAGHNIIEKTLEKDKVSDITPIAKNIWTFSTIVLFLFLILRVWDVNVTPFLASAGVVGIIVGLAARETVENFFGGLALYADGTYQRGDFIELDSSPVRGWVRDISIRSTVVHTLDGDSITIPNAKLHKSIVKNKTYPKNVFRISIDIGVSYDSDPNHVQKILEDAVVDMCENEDSLILNNPRPKVYLTEFGDSSINFDILTWISLPNQERIVRDDVNHRIYTELEKENIEIPYPQRTIHMNEKENENIGSE